MDIVARLESYTAYCEERDSAQLRKDAAEEIRAIRRQLEELQRLVAILGRNPTVRAA